MSMKPLYLILIAAAVIALLLWLLEPAGASTTAVSDFYLVYTDNYDDGDGAGLFLTSEDGADGNVTIPGIDFSQGFSIPPGGATRVDIPQAAEVHGSDEIADLGIRVTAGGAIEAYFLNPGEPSLANDAYAGLPVEMLGTEYIVLAWPDTLPARFLFNVGFSELAIVSPYDGNQLRITPSASTSGRTAGMTYTITLNQYQTYTLQSDSIFEDLTGTEISASMPVAVYAGSRCADVPRSYGWCDHLVEQMPPITAWGTAFATLPMASRQNGDILRVLASEDGTVVSITGAATALPAMRVEEGSASTCGAAPCRDEVVSEAPPNLQDSTAQLSTVSLNRGDFYEGTINSPVLISSNRPVLAAQYATGYNYARTMGDPLMMLLAPQELYQEEHSFYTPPGYAQNYANVVVPTTAVGTLILDNARVDASLFSPIGMSAYSTGILPVSPGRHILRAEQPFGLNAYGFGDYVSYGYVSGIHMHVPPDPERLPVVLIPGFAGTVLDNDEGRIWVDAQRMVDDSRDNWGFPTSSFLDVTRLNTAGDGPLYPDDPRYVSVQAGNVITRVQESVTIFDFPLIGEVSFELDLDIYQSTITYFEGRGYQLGVDLFLFGYDWRKDVRSTAEELDAFLDAHRNGGKVNLVSHSMGGVVTRAYLLEAERAEKVEHAAIVGSPLLGIPFAFKGLYFGDDYGINTAAHANGVPGFINLINEEKIREVAANWPGVYSLLPGQRYFDLYEEGYIQEDRDLNGDGFAAGALDYSQTLSLNGGLFNSALVDSSSAFHTSLFDGFDGGSNGTDVCLFVGVGMPTEERIRFWRETRWWGLVQVDRVSWTWGDGDQTVLRHSADLHSSAYDYRGDARVFYTNLDHGALIRNPYVLQQVSRCFAGDYSPVGESIALKPDAWRLDGTWIEVSAPVDVHLYDEQGNHVGPTVTGAKEYGILGVQYVVVGQDKSIFLPDGIRYRVEFAGASSGRLNMWVRGVRDGAVENTAVYREVPFRPGAAGTLPFTEVLGAPVALDREGDGVVDLLVEPSAVLTGDAGVETKPPTTKIELDGVRDEAEMYTGPVTVAMSATDNPDGSGLSHIEYSLDLGKTVQVYAGPFVLDAERVAVIYAKAVDAAGNEEFPLASARVGLYRQFVPLLLGERVFDF